MQPQLSFDDLFGQVFIPEQASTPEESQLKAGDHVSLTHKVTFEHEWGVVLHADDGLIITRMKGASDSPLNSCTQIYNLEKLEAHEGCYQNKIYAVEKVSRIRPRPDLRKFGLLEAFSKHLARKSHISMGIAKKDDSLA